MGGTNRDDGKRKVEERKGVMQKGVSEGEGKGNSYGD